jgi:hypothetical protein
VEFIPSRRQSQTPNDEINLTDPANNSSFYIILKTTALSKAGRMQTFIRRFFANAILALACLALLASQPVYAKILRVVIDTSKTQSPAYGGQSFGSVGQYEIIVGQAYGELDPNDRHNAIVQDIRFAPRNARGMVEYSLTFTLLKPVDSSKENGVLLYDVVNRGNRGLIQTFNGGNPGDGFLMKQGVAILSSAWQGDIIRSGPSDARETIQVPIARNPDGTPLTGPVLTRFASVPAGTNTVSLATAPGQRALTYQRPLTLDTSHATLATRVAEATDGSGAPFITVPSSDWAFADCTKTPFPGTPDPGKICVKNGFDPALLYQVVFNAKDPLVLGIGFAATRDLVSFFRHDAQDSAGAPNPLPNAIRFVVAQGTSQSGNFVKTFINLGFNEDESGRIVWDGANDHIAGRQLAMNLRFAVPGGTAEPYEPGSDGVLWWTDWPDTVRKRKTAGMLDRCTATHTCPKIMETFGSTEFWDLRMSPDLVGTSADKDIPLPANVRRYYFPGTTHGGGRGGFSTSLAAANRPCELAPNPNPEIYSMRALIAALIDWVTKGTPPPASRYPTLADGLLVTPTKAAMGFPTIFGLKFTNNFENPVFDYDFGSSFIYNDLSGIISNEPPAIKHVIKMLVPKVDADGNELGGVPSVLLQAPLGTYLGWNVTPSGFFKGQICSYAGGYMPFTKTHADRTASGDPRLSLEERYASHEAYVSKVKTAAQAAVKEGFLLPVDAQTLVGQAEASDVLSDKKN